jgi:hypothetical protein
MGFSEFLHCLSQLELCFLILKSGQDRPNRFIPVINKKYLFIQIIWETDLGRGLGSKQVLDYH